MSNFWGEPDDIEPMPDWMLPDNHPMKRKSMQGFKGLHNKSLEDACAEALRKPPVPILLKPPSEEDLK